MCMNDYINRQDAIKVALEYLVEYCGGAFDGSMQHGLAEKLKELPSANVRENIKGEWADTGSGQQCSVCKEVQYGYDNFRNFCPVCGADMRGSDVI